MIEEEGLCERERIVPVSECHTEFGNNKVKIGVESYKKRGNASYTTTIPPQIRKT
jgi:hypothetical protein